MTNPELAAAAERILASIKKADSDWGPIYDCDHEDKQWHLQEPYELAKHYLAQHDAEDDLPVTEEWLRSIGWKKWDCEDEAYDLWIEANDELSWKCRLATSVNGIYIVRMADNRYSDYSGESESVELLSSRNSTKKITRRAVRQLLQALGITTKGTAHE